MSENLTGICIRCNMHNMTCSKGREIVAQPHDNLRFNGHLVCQPHFEMLTFESEGNWEAAAEIGEKIMRENGHEE